MTDIEKPIQIQDKVEYLKTKLTMVLSKVKLSENFNFKLQFIQYLDSSIDSLYGISKQQDQRNLKISKQRANQSPSRTQNSTTTTYPKTNTEQQQQQQRNAYTYSNQKEKLQIQRLIYQAKLHQLNVKQQRLQNQKLKIKAQTQQIQRKSMESQYQNKIYDLKDEIEYQKQKNKNQQKQLQRLGKLNITQQNQIQKLKQQRDRAQASQYKLRQQYETQIKNSSQLTNKGQQPHKIKNSQGLKIKRTFCNLSQQKQAQKHILLDLPVVLQATKIVYGIKVGLQLSNRQIVYCDDISLFEKQLVRLSVQSHYLKAQYLKRKDNIISNKMKIHRPQVVVMLYGKGDSLSVHQ